MTFTRIASLGAAALLLAACTGGSGGSAADSASDSSPSDNCRTGEYFDAESNSCEPTVAYMLMAIDDGSFDELPTYERRIAQAANRCGASETEVADKVVRAQQLLDERGVTTSILDIIADGILGRISPSQAGNFSCTEELSQYLAQRVDY